MDKKNKTIGIIGGFGPESTADFYLRLIEKFKIENKRNYPEIFLYNTPITLKMENDFVKKGKDIEEYKDYIINGIKQLKKIRNIKVFTIPCNTIHIYLDDIIKKTNVKFISIVDESVSFIKKYNFKKVGLLGTPKTVKSMMYQNAFSKSNISVEVPTKVEQKELSIIISNILNNRKEKDDKNYILSIINSFKKNGCDCVLLACTELQILVGENDENIYIFDTMEILAEATKNYLNK